MTSPLVNFIVSYVVVNATLSVQEALLQSINVKRQTRSLTDDAPYLAVDQNEHQNEVGAARWPQIWSSERGVA